MRRIPRYAVSVALGGSFVGCTTGRAVAQTPADTAKKQAAATDSTQGLFGDVSPGKGFLVANTDAGTLNISAYMMARYMNQLPASQTYVTPAARRQFLRANYERLFDTARTRVRAWEAAHAC